MRTFRIAVAAALLLFLPQVQAAPCAGFTDVEDTDPFCANVAWLKSRNVTLGCAVSLYCPNDAVNRLAMAAFLNRLGDTLVPPGIVWVGQEGGMFQSIQQAIDYAAALPAPDRRVVRIAPGTYTGRIVMAGNVDVEGSGETATTITSTCGPGAGENATVSGSGGQLRRVTVSIDGGGFSGSCAAVDVGAGGMLRNVYVSGTAIQATLYGVRIALPAASYLTTPTLADVSVAVSHANFQVVGIDVTAPSPAHLNLRNVEVRATGPSPTALRFSNAQATLDRVTATAAQGVPNGSARVLFVDGASNILVTNASLRNLAGGTFAENPSAGASLKLANTLAQGTSSGTVTCLNVYSESLAAVVC